MWFQCISFCNVLEVDPGSNAGDQQSPLLCSCALSPISLVIFVAGSRASPRPAVRVGKAVG